MEIQATLAAFIAAVWVWGFINAKIVRLIITRDPQCLLVLPIWVMQGPGYISLSIINVGLLVGRYGLPIAVFVSFPLKTAATILGGAFVLDLMLTALIALIRPMMLGNFAAAALTIATGAAYCATRFN